MNHKRILIVAGEASGDLHAAKLVQEVRYLHPNVHFLGMGGPKMQAVGVEMIVDSSQMAVIGLTEVLPHLLGIYHAAKKIEHVLQNTSIDLVILIDYPTFNLHIAKLAKKANVPVLYYISPKIWASRPKRIKKIPERVNLMAVIFPFEVDIYRQAKIPVCLVKHPLLAPTAPYLTPIETKRNKIIGLLPGSRKGEIKRMLPVYVQATRQLKKLHPDLQFILPLASTLTEADVAPYLAHAEFPIQVVSNRTYEVICRCDAVIATSGTATLETALLGTPMVIAYKVAPITYLIALLLVKVKYIGLCNIIAGREIVKEFIQSKANPDLIAAEINKILTDDVYRTKMIAELRAVRSQLESPEASELAPIVTSML